MHKLKRRDRVAILFLAINITAFVVALAVLFWVGSQPALSRERYCPALPYQVQSALDAVRAVMPVKVTSLCGGRHARNSFHYRGRAVDFRVPARHARSVVSIVRGHGGQLCIKHYGGGLFHLDDGGHRRW